MNKELIFGLNDKENKIIKYCIEFLKSEEEFERAKVKLSIIPTFLFFGFPGTGKTTIARNVYQKLKKEFNIDLKYLRMDELISSSFGESSKNLIDFFTQIQEQNKKNNSYTFVIVNELDFFTVNRFQNDNDSIRRVLLTFNTIIDDMVLKGTINKIILIATTNMKESIDTSVLRRFFFHENFDVFLDKIDFFRFIDEIALTSQVFSFVNQENKKELFKIYQEKHFTLGEIKKIFAHLYMEIKSREKDMEFNLKSFSEQRSYYEIIMKQLK